jgi:hypothetical protein
LRAVARVMIVGGGCRGRGLAGALVGQGHAVRITTRGESGRAAIEAVGAECWVGTPDRLATLRGALDGVTIACWMLGSVRGEPGALAPLHRTRLELFVTQAIDTTVRGILYEERGTSTPPADLRAGAEIVRSIAARNMIPAAFLASDPDDLEGWREAALAAIESLLERA